MHNQARAYSMQRVIASQLRCVALRFAGVMAILGTASGPVLAQSGAKPLTLVPGRSDGAVQADGGRYALVIGINDYCDELNQHGTSDLKYSVKGAREVYTALTTRGGFAPNHVKLLLDGQATHDAILTYLDSLSNRSVFPGGEMFLLYFSGHGMLYDTRSNDPNAVGQRDNVLVPVDGRNTTALAASHNISLQEVLLDLQRAGNFPRQILLLDACRSVEQLEGAMGFSGTPAFDFNFAAYKPYAHGRLVYSSCSPGQRSWEDAQLQDGVFTHFVVDALTRMPGAGNADGVVTMGGLEEYVSNYMAEWSQSHADRIQTPQAWGIGDPSMPLTLVRRPATLTARQQATQLYSQALTAQKAGHQDEALGLHLQAAATDPTWAWPHFAAAKLYRTQKRTAEAIAADQTAVRLDPQWAWPHNDLGIVYFEQKRFDEAIGEYKAAIRLDGKYTYPHNNLGNLYEDQQRYAEAIAEYQTAIRLDSQYAGPHNGLGVVYDNQKRYDEAIAEYKTAIRLDPQFASPHNGLGVVYKARQRYDEAIAEYKTAIRLDPQYAIPHNNLGSVYDDQKRYDEAIAEYKTAIRLDPQYASPHNGLGVVYFAKQLYAEAIAEYQVATQLDPQDAKPHFNLGLIYKVQQRYDEAIAQFRKGGALAPNDPDYATQIKATQAAKAKAGK